MEGGKVCALVSVPAVAFPIFADPAMGGTCVPLADFGEAVEEFKAEFEAGMETDVSIALST